MSIEALKLALEALKANDLLINGTEKAGGLAWCIDGYYSDCFDIDPINEQTERAITAIREALAQPEQEPVAWMFEGIKFDGSKHGPHLVWKPEYMDAMSADMGAVAIPLYTTPPQRKPLSNQKIIEMYNEPRSDAEMIEFARAIEAAHGIWPENSDCYGPDWTDRDGEYLK